LQKTKSLERKKILDWAKLNLVNSGVTVSRAELNNDISFSNSGIKEAVNQPHNHYHEKNQAIKNIVDLLLNSTYAGTAKDTKGRCLQFHYFKTTINGDDSFIVVKENYDRTFRFYSIVDHMK
jgi:hypothetical protein